MGRNVFSERLPAAVFPRMSPAFYNSLKARIVPRLEALYHPVTVPPETPGIRLRRSRYRGMSAQGYQGGHSSVGVRHLHGDRESPWICAEHSLARRSHIQLRDTHPTRRGLALCYRPGGGQGGEAGPRTVVHLDRSTFLRRHQEPKAQHPLPIVRRIRNDPGDDGKNRRTHTDLRWTKGRWTGILCFVD